MVSIHAADLLVDADLEAYHEVAYALHREVWPDNPPRSAQDRRLEMERRPDFVTIRHWIARDVDRPIGIAAAIWRGGVDNQDLADLFVGVVPSERRRGLGGRLASEAARAALENGRTKVILDSDSKAESGVAVLEHWGGKKGIVNRISRLDLATLDEALIDAWIAQGETLTDEFELLFWGPGHLPHEYLQDFADLVGVMNSAPLEDLDVEPFVLTVDQLVQYEASRIARGVDQWTTVVRHKPSGEFAGFTDMLVLPYDRTILRQRGTGIWHKYRGKGLGRWIKAYHLKGVRAFVPEARWVHTTNAGSNRAMLNINEAMGFLPYKHNTAWQFRTEDLLQRVTRPRAA